MGLGEHRLDVGGCAAEERGEGPEVKVVVPDGGGIQGQAPVDVQVVGCGSRCVELRPRRGCPRGNVTGSAKSHSNALQVPAHERAVAIGTELGQEGDLPTQPGKAERHVGCAATGMGRDGAVAAFDAVDYGLADDLDACVRHSAAFDSLYSCQWVGGELRFPGQRDHT